MDNLLSQIYTLKDLNDFKQGLATLEDSLYQTEGELPNSVPESLRTLFTRATDKKVFLDQVEKGLTKAKIIRATLAFIPRDEFLAGLGTWVKQKYGPAAVLDIETDESIIGGIIIESDGKVQDLSIANMFDSL